MKILFNSILLLLFNTINFAETDTLWTKTFGTLYSDGANAICETNERGYLLAGYTYSSGFEADIWLVKTDANGNLILENKLGGAGWDIANGVCLATDDEGYIITGYTNSIGAGSRDVFLLKTDNQLNQIWFKNYGGSGLDIGRSVSSTSDGGYIICGYTESFGAGENDVYLIKTDENGDAIWTKTIGCERSDMGHSAYETADGNFIIAGSSGLYDSPGIASGKNREILVAKVNSFGTLINSKTFWVIDNDQGDYDAGYSICESSDGSYYVAGVSSAEGIEVLDISVIKMDTSLTIIWKKNKEAGFYDFGYAVCESAEDNGVIVCGNFNIAQTGKSNVLIIRFASNGDEVWRKIYGGTGNDEARSIFKTSDKKFIIGGHTDSYGAGSNDMWLLKLEEDLTGIDTESKFSPETYFLNQNYPNPFNPSTLIEYQIVETDFVSLKVYDVLGNEIAVLVNEEKTAGNYEIKFSTLSLPSGIYFYRLKTGNYTRTNKMMLLK